jgi:sec-independent protein translocase protein TatB
MLSPDIGVSEMVLVAAVALIVVGPKDLPMLMRRVGQFVARLRGMASEFRASFEDMARQSELEDLRKEVEAMRSGSFTQPLHDAAASIQDPGVDQVFAEIDAGLKGGEISFAPPMGYNGPGDAAEATEPEVAVPAKAPRKPRAKAIADKSAAAAAPEAKAKTPRKASTKSAPAKPAKPGAKSAAKPSSSGAASARTGRSKPKAST